jgi:cyclohexanone monooxygenase
MTTAERTAESPWVIHNQEAADATLFPMADTRYMGANIPGKPRVFMPDLDVVGPLRAKCAAVVENGWRGFAIDGEAVPAREEVFA